MTLALESQPLPGGAAGEEPPTPTAADAEGGAAIARHDRPQTVVDDAAPPKAWSAFRIKTPSEQRLEWLESLKRPLTDEESAELQRALHAVYCRQRKAAA